MLSKQAIRTIHHFVHEMSFLFPSLDEPLKTSGVLSILDAHIEQHDIMGAFSYLHGFTDGMRARATTPASWEARVAYSMGTFAALIALLSSMSSDESPAAERGVIVYREDLVALAKEGLAAA